MSEQPEPPTKADVSSSLSKQALYSIGMSFHRSSRPKNPGYVLAISEDTVAFASYYSGSGNLGCQFGGKPIEGSLEEFIQNRAADPKCIGIVPVTQPALEALESQGLKVLRRGFVVVGSNYSAALYGIEEAA